MLKAKRFFAPLLCLLLGGWTIAAAAVVGDDTPTPNDGVAPTETPTVDSDACPIGNILRDVFIPPEPEVVARPKKEAWERSVGGTTAARPLLKARLRGWPRQLLIDKATLPRDDREFLWRLARDTWHGIESLTDREHELPLDHVRFGVTGVAVSESNIGDYTSASNVGLYLAALAAASEIGVVPRTAAVERIKALFHTLDQLETDRGFFFNYYDTTSLERSSNFISFVDSSWLTAGMIVVRNTFPELAEAASRYIDRTNYSFFYDSDRQLMAHGFYVNSGRRAPFHYGVFYTEARLGSLLAIGKGDAPEALWFSMARTYPPACSWQSLMPKNSRVRMVHGFPVRGGYYEWKGVRFVPSWGGSMFEALMPALFVDELKYAPDGLGANDKAHVEIQRRYATEERGDRVWGASPCSTPLGDGYSEYGVPFLGSRGYRAGAVTAHAAALALLVDPPAATANLRALAENYDAYGELGLYDGVDPSSGVVAHKYLALDQSMLFLALANYLGDHVVQKRFAADPIVQKALPLLADERFFD
ncbi:MAG: DUF3131 domain-containing protein [Deltaproteobacteria bacterium]|nr:DUF3131 domain-containing protein [Deltaproteobacteria bacterium]